MYPKQTILCEKGFSLIELSIVLVIVGLLMSAGVGIMNSVSKTSKIAKEKANITMIKNALISHAFSHGRLPDKINCSPPDSELCELPLMALNLSSVSKDTWSLPYGYDVTDRLTSTSSDNFCSTLYQLNNYKSWLVEDSWPLDCAPNFVCVTKNGDPDVNKNDTNDNGTIDSDNKGYYLAAYVVSRGEDKKFGAKNDNKDREYEMSSNPYNKDDDRDDLVGELSFGEIIAKICNDKNTTIVVESSGKLGIDSLSCDNSVAVPPPNINDVTVSLRGSVFYGDTCKQMSFKNLAKCDAGFSVTDCTTGNLYDEKVNLN